MLFTFGKTPAGMKNSPVILIYSVLVLASAIYSCRKEKPDPPSVTTKPVTQINATSGLSGGEITAAGDSPVTARGVCWSTQPEPSVNNAHTNDSSGTGSYTSTITGLQAGTSYYVRAYATNIAGTAYGQELVFDNSWEQDGTFIDMRDNKEYKWVSIGDQVWMAENLAFMPSVSPPWEGSSADPYYYVYDYRSSNVGEARAYYKFPVYGALYNWPAAMVSCPAGWHLPTDAEWTELTDYLGGESIAGGKLKESGRSHWHIPNTGATNASGFTALPGGDRDYVNDFYYMGSAGFWWSATEYSSNEAWDRAMYYGNSSVVSDNFSKELGSSVRCLRD